MAKLISSCRLRHSNGMPLSTPDAGDNDRKAIMVRLNELLNRRSYIRNLVTNVQKELL